jgi:hypothetical protein
MDWLICNLAGCLIGQWVIRKLRLPERDYFKGFGTDFLRTLTVFRILSYRPWMFCVLLGFKSVSLLPSAHWLNMYRVVAIIASLDLTCTEMYERCEGRGRWVFVMIMPHIYLFLDILYCWYVSLVLYL